MDGAKAAATRAIRAAGGDESALVPPVLERMETDGTKAEDAVAHLRRFPAYLDYFGGPQTRADLKTPKEKSDYIAEHGLDRFLALPAREGA